MVKTDIKYFHSIALLLECNSSRDNFSVPVNRLVKWLIKYDAFFKDVLKINSGENLHTLYHRDVSIIGSGILHLWSLLGQIGYTARNIGFSYSLTIDSSKAIADRAYLDKFISLDVVNIIGLRADANFHSVPGRDFVDLVKTLIEKGMMVSLLGDVKAFQTTLILEQPFFNASDITIYPCNLMTVPESSTKKYHVSPCYRRFRLYVDIDGMIYPCLGLVGLVNCTIGTVFADNGEIDITQRISNMPLELLAMKGPQIQFNDKQTRQTGLPFVCEVHRQSCY